MKLSKDVWVAALMLGAGLVPIKASGQLSRGDRYAGAPWATRSPVLARHGMALPEWRLFHGQPRALETPWGILRAALAGQARALMDVGLLVLVVSPPLQLLLATAIFQRFGDHLYSALSLAVLALLLAGFSLGW